MYQPQGGVLAAARRVEKSLGLLDGLADSVNRSARAVLRSREMLERTDPRRAEKHFELRMARCSRSLDDHDVVQKLDVERPL